MIVSLDPGGERQLLAALRIYMAQQRRNGVVLHPDLLELMRSVEARSGQERPRIAPPSAAPDTAAMPPILVDYAAAALALGVSVRTVRRRVAEGRLPTVTLGRARRIPTSALLDLAQANAGPGVPDA